MDIFAISNIWASSDIHAKFNIRWISDIRRVEHIIAVHYICWIHNSKRVFDASTHGHFRWAFNVHRMFNKTAASHIGRVTYPSYKTQGQFLKNKEAIFYVSYWHRQLCCRLRIEWYKRNVLRYLERCEKIGEESFYMSL